MVLNERHVRFLHVRRNIFFVQSSITYADEQGANSSENPASRPVSMGGNGSSDSIMDWLLDLRLEALWPNFEAHG